MNLLARLLLLCIVACFPLGALAHEAHEAHASWYKKQMPTPETKKLYGIEWVSCCEVGDVCQDCVVHRYAKKPPWSDGFYYTNNGVTKRLPDHIIETVPWTPTGKPVLFLAPFSSGNIQKGEPVCLKVPGGGV